MQILVGFNADEPEDYYDSKMKYDFVKLHSPPIGVTPSLLCCTPTDSLVCSDFWSPSLMSILV